MQNTFEDLEDAGCIKITEDSVAPTMLGSMASQYYLKYLTVSMFGSNIGPDTSLEVSINLSAHKYTPFIFLVYVFAYASCLQGVLK